MEVLVFKTSVENRNQAGLIISKLEKLSGILHVTIDLDDCDKVLRAEVNNVDPRLMVQVLTHEGFQSIVEVNGDMIGLENLPRPIHICR